LPQKNAGKQKTAVAEKPQEPAAETKKEEKIVIRSGKN